MDRILGNANQDGIVQFWREAVPTCDLHEWCIPSGRRDWHFVSSQSCHTLAKSPTWDTQRLVNCNWCLPQAEHTPLQCLRGIPRCLVTKPFSILAARLTFSPEKHASDHSRLFREVNKRWETEKAHTNVWRLNNALINNQWIKEETTGK